MSDTRPTPPLSAPDIVSKIREALVDARGRVARRCHGQIDDALRLLPQLEAMRANQSPMDIGEHNPNSEWMPPTLDTIARWKQYQVISRRDWVNVLTLLDKHMAMLAGCEKGE